MKKKVFIFTCSRADYSPLQNVISAFENSKKYKTKIIVTGQHLDVSSGNTIKEIRKNHKLKILKIFSVVKNQKALDISIAQSIIIKKISQFFTRYNPDFLILLGDRYELLPCAMACIQFKIPIVHLHGGEVTSGSLDNIYRNTISKIANIHFVCHEEYKKNLIRLGEKLNRIFNFGAPSLENIPQTILNKNQIKFKKKTFLVTYHPNTINPKKTKIEIIQLMESLKYLRNYNFILSQPNLDINNREILKIIKRYKKYKNITLKKSLGKKDYFSALNSVNGIIGNSSSIILESSSFKLPALNLGNRQKGRILTKNIISCNFKKKEIIKNIEKISSEKFKKKISNIQNPFYKKYTSKKIINKLSSLNLDKIFYEKLT
ncbi:UDP-N-acetylglucosamine 2-epimerase [Candidatus Pelagibacter sp.]|nr:UDP-N-acetylglucosamine 2-epimerase [Candidatus Pelagibacter sp.]